MKKQLKNELLIIITIFIIFRLFILIGNQTLHDEVVDWGLISKHVIEKDNYSVFDYSHAFQGWLVLESYFNVPITYFFGMSRITARIVPFIFSLILLIIFFLFLEKNFNKKVAVISSLLYIFSPPSFITSNLFDHIGHFVGIFFSFVMMFFFYQIFFNKKITKTNFILLGIFSGFGAWVYPTPLIMLLVCFIFWFAFDKKFFLKNYFFYIYNIIYYWISSKDLLQFDIAPPGYEFYKIFYLWGCLLEFKSFYTSSKKIIYRINSVFLI